MTIDPRIESLELVGFAKRGAYALLAQFPAIVFTSGRRTPTAQANAMAGNILTSGNRAWIGKTYKPHPVVLACQKWVNANPQARTKAQLAAGLLSVFAQVGDEELLKLSHHFTGRAFDVRPYCVPLHALKLAASQLAGLEDFLDHEGNLERWHLEFAPEPETKVA